MFFTVGHGARTTEELQAVLEEARVRRCVDVRRYPASRRHPHFARQALERSLPGAGIAYEWWGEELGGRRRARPVAETRHPAWQVEAFRAYAEYMDTPSFRQAFEKLLAIARGTDVAVMCAETLWWQCHRRLLADAATLHGMQVLHLGIGREPRPHRLHEAARAEEGGWPVYDVGVLPLRRPG